MTIADTFRHLGLSAPDPRSDGELLTRFVAVREEAAFAELLRRHGPTVYGVCRRVLGNAPDADDAFQAVFLVLARKANTVRPPGMVGNWLYGVAVRTANKARVMNAKRRVRESGLLALRAESEPARGASRPLSDELAVIDAELAALPEVYRAAFVTCELNGRSRSEASRELGWPEGTVAARLAKARELLAARLTKRGVTLGVGLFAAAVVPTATAAEALSAVRELLAVGTASAVAPAAQTLSDDVVKTMNPFNWKLVAVATAVVLSAGVGGAVLLAAPGDKPIREHIKAPAPKAEEAEWKEGKPIELEDAGRITGTAVSADGKFIAITQDGKLTVLAADTRKKQYEIKYVEPGAITGVAFNPKGDKLAVTRKDAVDICEAATGKGIDTWELKGFNPHQVIWFTDKDSGEHLVATNGEDTRHRDAKGKEKGHGGWAGNGHMPTVLAPVHGTAGWLMHTDNAQKGDETAIWCWNWGTDRIRPLTGHTERPTSAAVSNDGKRIVTADVTGQLIVWDAAECKEESRFKLTQGIQRVALAPDGKTLAVVLVATDKTLQSDPPQWEGDLEVYLIDITDPPKEPKPLWRSPHQDGRYLGQSSVAFSPDGKTLLAAFADPYLDADDAKKRGLVPKSMGVKVWELVPKK